ncbi:conserved hypothetical protein [Uncinocarpus reesii 1704]|uniref:Uncharacterized protein n=1 Tax=Uncinocarpus reesii (strain UAMH 1704) TaxID=336963 RepID=C4JWF4_UNCRE|nr:uncharacterized protein UREG_06896 [Uncinocarpus reesii 1704]EEP82031.1 conserved hypothetical protein [Uncinocarpus reesii 1704]
MYIPPVHAEERLSVLHQIIRDNPLGILTTAIESPNHPLILSSHIPFLLDVPETADGTLPNGILRGHLARQNPQSKVLTEALAAAARSEHGPHALELPGEVLVVFNGPHQHYVTPKFYTETKPRTGKVAPTWNYSAVQAYGRITVYSDSGSAETQAFLQKQLEDLTLLGEKEVMGFTEPWEVGDAPESWVRIFKKLIVGVEIRIERLQGKVKMSQELPRGDREGVIEGFERMDTEAGKGIARAVRECATGNSRAARRQPAEPGGGRRTAHPPVHDVQIRRRPGQTDPQRGSGGNCASSHGHHAAANPAPQADFDGRSYVYSREFAPNATRFEAILSSLLNGHAVSYSSGLAAVHAALVLLNPRRISVGDGYHGCHEVISVVSRLSGLQKLALDCPAESLGEGDVILLETPVNPLGTAFSIAEYAQKAHARGAYLIVDSTFAPPGLQDPFLWGADLVMHSGSKYFGGHSDLLCGVLATQRQDWAKRLFEDRVALGNVVGSLEGWLGVRSLRTLEIRVQRASQNCAHLVSWLQGALIASSPAQGSEERIVQTVLQRIYHASLQDEPWLLQQMPNGFGPVFSIVLQSETFARTLPSRLAFFHHATSLGGVESLIEWRAMSDSRVDRKLLRVSVGIENWQDLKDDLLQAFRSLAGSSD